MSEQGSLSAAVRQWGWPVGIALLVLATLPLVGWIAAVAACAVLVGGVAAARWPALRVVLAGCGGLVGAVNALQALVRHAPSEDRWWWGVAALALALIASASLAFGRRVIGIMGSVLGAVAINLFDINTFYVVALALWCAAAVAPSQVLHSHPADSGP